MPSNRKFIPPALSVQRTSILCLFLLTFRSHCLSIVHQIMNKMINNNYFRSNCVFIKRIFFPFGFNRVQIPSALGSFCVNYNFLKRIECFSYWYLLPTPSTRITICICRWLLPSASVQTLHTQNSKQNQTKKKFHIITSISIGIVILNSNSDFDQCAIISGQSFYSLYFLCVIILLFIVRR